MKFRIVCTIDSGYLGPLMEALHPFPIEHFGMQPEFPELHIPQAYTAEPAEALPDSLPPRILMGKKSRSFKQRGLKPTIKTVIWNFINGSKEPRTIVDIRNMLVSRGYNPNSIPSAFQELKNKGKLEEAPRADGRIRPKRYVAK